MAENKKSFVLYSDLLTVVRKLVEQDRISKTNYAGELFLVILEYVNDLNPIPIDFIVEMAFEPIKLQLKRDLMKYEVTKEKRSKAGIKSAEIKKQNSTKSTHVESVEHTSTKSTVNDNDNVTVNVNDNVITSTNVDVEKEKFEDDFQNFKIIFYKNLSDDFDFVFEIQKIRNQLDEEISENQKTFLSQKLNFLISEKRKKVPPKKENSHQEFVDELKCSSEWLDLISIQNQNIPIESIISKLDEFTKHLKTSFKTHSTKTEFVNHFKSWLPKKIPDKQNQVLIHNR